MDHFVIIDKLPEGVVLPADMKDRLWYDGESRRLHFRGVMSKAEFDRLCLLTDDWSFRRPLEDLFRLSVPEPPKPKGLRRLVAVLTSFGA